MRALEPWVGRRAGGDIGNTVGEGSDLSFGAQERSAATGGSGQVAKARPQRCRERGCFE